MTFISRVVGRLEWRYLEKQKPCMWQVLESDSYKGKWEIRYSSISCTDCVYLSFLLSFGPAVTTLHHIPRESPELASQDVVSFVWCLWKTGAQATGCGYVMVLLALSVLRSPLSTLFQVGRPLPSCVQVTGRHPARLCGLWGPGGQGPWLVNEWLEMSHLGGPCAKSTPLLLRPYHPACRGVRLGPVQLLMWPRCAMAAFYVLDRQTSSHLFFPPALSFPASGWSPLTCCFHHHCQTAAASAIGRLFIFRLFFLHHSPPLSSPLPFSAHAGSGFIWSYSSKEVPSSRSCCSGTFLSLLVARRPGFHCFLLQVQFSSVQSFSHVRLFAAPRIAACQASLSITNSRSLLKLISIGSVMPSNHLILCPPLLLLPSIFPSISFKIILNVWGCWKFDLNKNQNKLYLFWG